MNESLSRILNAHEELLRKELKATEEDKKSLMETKKNVEEEFINCNKILDEIHTDLKTIADERKEHQTGLM